jgi:hypothetical protein
MKRPKKPQKKEAAKVRSSGQPRESQELSEDQLESVAGGAGGDRPQESVTLNFTKIELKY